MPHHKPSRNKKAATWQGSGHKEQEIAASTAITSTQSFSGSLIVQWAAVVFHWAGPDRIRQESSPSFIRLLAIAWWPYNAQTVQVVKFPLAKATCVSRYTAIIGIRKAATSLSLTWSA